MPSARYAEIKTYLAQAISSGRLAPADRLPSESDLVGQFGVSRMTVNRALRELKDEGLITRHAGVGSFVAERALGSHFIEVRNIADEIRERGHEHRAVVLKNAAQAAKAEDAAHFGVAPQTKLHHSVILHLEAGQPLLLEDRLVLASKAPGYGEQDFSTITPSEYLSRIAPLHRFDHEVRAVPATPEVRRHLALSSGEPALLLVRRTWSDDRIVSYARLYHPGSRFSLSDSFKT